MPGREEVLHLAEEMGVTVTSLRPGSPVRCSPTTATPMLYRRAPWAPPTMWFTVRKLASDVFLSESAWNILTGDDLDLEPGTAASSLMTATRDSSGAGSSVTLVTNHLTGEQLAVTPAEPLRSTIPSGIPGAGRRGLCRASPRACADDWREVGGRL